ncbi:MAG: 4Fe-4S binding protein [Nitrospirales bacterium]|nr:4Fe-4S binding protein [Nitrospirales bacterium]
MTIERIQPYRRIVEALQALIIIGLPFVTVHGESALRFDIPSLMLHFFGVSLRMDEFFIVLIATIFWTFLIVLVTQIFGRIWCGWLCPQTVLVDYTRFVDKAQSRGIVYKILSYSATFVVSAIVAASLVWYFVSPYDFFSQLFAGRLGSVTWGFWIVLTGIIFLNFALVRHKFCSTVCPYSKLQSVLFDNKTMIIAFDPQRKDECMNCKACVRTCPVGIDIREGLSPACINCAECIDACTKRMKTKQKKSLIGYSFGFPGEVGRIIRQNVILIGAVTLVFLVFLVYLMVTRVPLDMTVTPNYNFPPRISGEGKATNSFILSVENRARVDMDLLLGVEGDEDEDEVKVSPERITVKAGEDMKLTIFVTMDTHKDHVRKKKSSEIEIYLQSTLPHGVKVEKEARFITPEAE